MSTGFNFGLAAPAFPSVYCTKLTTGNFSFGRAIALAALPLAALAPPDSANANADTAATAISRPAARRNRREFTTSISFALLSRQGMQTIVLRAKRRPRPTIL